LLTSQPTELINFRNGLLEWKTEILRSHSPETLSTIQLPVDWNSSATCPRIQSFLKQVLPPDCLDFIHEVVGYLMVCIATLRVAFLFIGGGANGKSTLIALIRALLGILNISSVTLQDLSENRFRSAELFGKLANLCGDLDPRAIKKSDIFKTVVGGSDIITVERKYNHPFSFVPFIRLLFSCNEAPPSADQTEAYFNRWVVIPFPNVFKDEKDDKMLLQQLTTKEELSGLAVLAVRDLKKLMDRGYFELPASVEEAREKYREKLDSVKVFLSEQCEIDPLFTVGKTVLYQKYQEWCKSNGRIPVGGQRFGEKLTNEIGPDRVKEVRPGGGNRVWQGVGLVNNTPDGPAPF